MGWKGSLRKISSASNQIARESERQQRAQEREDAKKTKLEMQIDAALDKPMKELKKLLASGKVDIKKYNDLASRQNDLERELFDNGDIRAAMSALGVRYLTGRIDKKEFEILRDEILGDLAEHRRKFLETEVKLKKIVPNYGDFNHGNDCIMCGKKSGIFSGLKVMTVGTDYKKITLNVCSRCASELKTELS